jgi:Uma2 family endonuclease
MAITQRRMTFQEFLDLPEADEKPYLEFYDGVVTEKVSPKGKHSVLHDELIWHLNRAARPNRSARIFPELRTTFARASRVPDIAVYRWGRIPREPSGEVAPDFFDPPDIAIEILSPGQAVAELIDKCRWYVEHGVEIALLVVDRDRTVRRFHRGADMEVLRGEDPIDLGSVLPSFRLTVRDLFDSLSLA